MNARIYCYLRGHRWVRRIYPAGLERCTRCHKRRHGITDKGVAFQ